jgi:hypothetical protein
MFLLSIPIIIQILLLIHVAKTGRDRFWIYILIFIPIAGGVAYIFVELLPEFFNSRTIRVAHSNLNQVMAPDKEFDILKSRVALSPTFENSKMLGDEYLKRKNYSEAIELYTSCLEGIYSEDIDVMFKLAKAFYGFTKYESAISILSNISSIQKDNIRPDVLLMHAEIEYKLGNLSRASELFQSAANRGSDFEYQYRYGKFLLESGDTSQANIQFQQIMDMYATLPSYSRKQNRKWINLVNEEIRNL